MAKADDQAPPDGEPLPDVADPPFLLSHDEECTPEGPCISFYALTGQLVPSTLKLADTVNGHEVIVLIDGGSTNNFIQSQLAAHLHLTVQPTANIRVTVGNGETLSCGGECTGVALMIGGVAFTVDLLLFPIYGADLVLGVQ